MQILPTEEDVQIN